MSYLYKFSALMCSLQQVNWRFNRFSTISFHLHLAAFFRFTLSTKIRFWFATENFPTSILFIVTAFGHRTVYKELWILI